MEHSQIIDGLLDLARDRKSFLTGDRDYDSIFQKDHDVLIAAAALIQNQDVEIKALRNNQSD